MSEEGINPGYQGSLGQNTLRKQVFLKIARCKKQWFHCDGNKPLGNHPNATEEPWEGNVILLYGITMLWVAKMLSSFTETLIILQKHISFVDRMFRLGFMRISPSYTSDQRNIWGKLTTTLNWYLGGKKKKKDQKTRKNIAQKCYRQTDASPPQEKMIPF